MAGWGFGSKLFMTFNILLGAVSVRGLGLKKVNGLKYQIFLKDLYKIFFLPQLPPIITVGGPNVSAYFACLFVLPVNWQCSMPMALAF